MTRRSPPHRPRRHVVKVCWLCGQPAHRPVTVTNTRHGIRKWVHRKCRERARDYIVLMPHVLPGA